MSNAPDNWPHSIDSTPVQKDTIWAKEIPLLCQIWWICQVMNMHYVGNTDVCCRRLIPCKSWWDTKFLWILRTFFNWKPVFWEWQWCLKCVQGQTLGELPLVEYHWDWLCFSKEAFNEDWMSLQEVREVLSLCCIWEFLGSSCNSVQAKPCTAQSMSPTWCCKEGGCLACHSRETFEMMHRSWLLLPCVWQSTFLLQSGNQVQIPPKADVC